MPVNTLHRESYWTMQDILNQMDIRTELKTKLNELENVLENKKNRKKGSWVEVYNHWRVQQCCKEGRT